MYEKRPAWSANSTFTIQHSPFSLPTLLEPAAHVLPLNDLVVDLAEAAADHAAEEVEELQRRVRIHGEDLVERGAVDGEDGGVGLVSLGVGGAGLVVDEGHLSEEVAAVEHRQC